MTIHYSDDETDYPVLFQLWEPADLEKLEQGIRAAGITLKASKEALKESDPQKWRGYLLGVWRRASQAHPCECLALLISAGLTQGQPLQHIMAPLINAICRV